MDSIQGVSIEGYVLAVAEIVGPANIVAASRAYSGVIVFFKHMDSVEQIVSEGISIGGNFVSVSSLDRTATKVVLSNVPPYIPNGLLTDILTQYGNASTSMRTLPLGIKSLALKHVQSFRRQVSIFIKDALPESLSIEYAGRTHRIFY
jgi:hypothetical protein